MQLRLYAGCWLGASILYGTTAFSGESPRNLFVQQRPHMPRPGQQKGTSDSQGEKPTATVEAERANQALMERQLAARDEYIKVLEEDNRALEGQVLDLEKRTALLEPAFHLPATNHSAEDPAPPAFTNAPPSAALAATQTNMTTQPVNPMLARLKARDNYISLLEQTNAVLKARVLTLKQRLAEPTPGTTHRDP